MNPFEYEDLALERLNEMRREAEAMRISAGQPEPMLASIRWLARRVWLLAGLAAQRPPRRSVRPGNPTLAAWRLRSPNR